LRELSTKKRALQRLPFAFWVHRAASVFIKRLPIEGVLKGVW